MSKLIRIDDEVRDVLMRSEISGNKVVLPKDLPRPLYVRVDKVLGASGGKWNRNKGGHIFAEGDPRELLGLALRDGAVENHQQALQQFFTPGPVASELVALAAVERSHDCLEPSAGTGRIADAMRSAGVLQPMLVELDTDLADKLRKRGYERVIQGDFLKTRGDVVGLGEPAQLFDRIVMNPPFHNGTDVAHVLHAHSLLRRGGVLVAIMSPAFEYRSTSLFARFRALLEDRGIVVRRLAKGTFEDTEIETVIVRIGA